MRSLRSPKYHSAGVTVYCSLPMLGGTACETLPLRLDLHHAGLVSWCEIVELGTVLVN